MTRRIFLAFTPTMLALPSACFGLMDTIDARKALHLWRIGFFQGPFLLMATNWRVEHSDDFEELTSDELDDPEFLQDFAGATFEIWPSHCVRN